MSSVYCNPGASSAQREYLLEVGAVEALSVGLGVQGVQETRLLKVALEGIEKMLAHGAARAGMLNKRRQKQKQKGRRGSRGSRGASAPSAQSVQSIADCADVPALPLAPACDSAHNPALTRFEQCSGISHPSHPLPHTCSHKLLCCFMRLIAYCVLLCFSHSLTLAFHFDIGVLCARIRNL